MLGNWHLLVLKFIIWGDLCSHNKNFHEIETFPFCKYCYFLCCNKNLMKLSVHTMIFAFKFNIWVPSHPNNTYTNFYYRIKNGSDCKIEILQFCVKFCWGWRNPLICWNQLVQSRAWVAVAALFILYCWNQVAWSKMCYRQTDKQTDSSGYRVATANKRNEYF